MNNAQTRKNLLIFYLSGVENVFIDVNKLSSIFIEGREFAEGH